MDALLIKAKEAYANGQTNEFFKNIITVLDDPDVTNEQVREEALSIFYKVCQSYGKKKQRATSEYIDFYKEQSQNPNNSFAACYLGECYLTGNGVEQDNREALRLLKQAVENNNENNHLAMYLLGYLHMMALSSKDNDIYDIQKAVSLLETAMKNGSIYATFMMGDVLICGTGCEPDIHKGINLMVTAAKSEHATNAYMQHICGIIYQYHYKLMDLEKALQYYEMAYANGHVYSLVKMIKIYNRTKIFPFSVSQMKELVRNVINDLLESTKLWSVSPYLYLGDVYENGCKYNGVTIIKKDLDKALYYFTESVANNEGNLEKYYRSAQIYFDKGDFTNSLKYVTDGIAKGEYKCACFLAIKRNYFVGTISTNDIMQLLDKGISRYNSECMWGLAIINYQIKNDYKTAYELFIMAKKRNAVCPSWLYYMHKTGQHVKKSEEKAMKYLLLGLKIENKETMLTLANYYQNNENINTAIEIYLRIIEINHSIESKTAAIRLAEIYKSRNDIVLAIKYYIKSDTYKTAQQIISSIGKVTLMAHPKYNDLLKILSKINRKQYFKIIPEWLREEIEAYQIKNLTIEI